MRTEKIRILIGVLFFILLSGLIYMQLLMGGYYYSLSNRNCVRVIAQEGARGRILDCNGETIVSNRLSYNISVLPKEFRQDKNTIIKLASMLGVSIERINKIIKKNLVSSFSPIAVRQDVDKRLAILIEENRFDLPGVIVQTIPKRSYPYGNIASHIVGYLSEIDNWRITKLKDYGYKVKDIIGFQGVEEVMDQNLRAQEGGTQVLVDHRGRMNRVLGFKAPVDGKDIRLTINVRIQKIVEEELGGKKGAAVLLDPATGKVIALASSPNFYPGAFTEENKRDYVSSLLNDREIPLFNRAVSGQYPLASVFKVISATAALEKNKITQDKRFFCSGKMAIGRREFKCWDVHNSQNLIEAIAHSCDIYFYHVALLLGPDILTEYAVRFGLGKLTGIDLLNESTGHVPSTLARRMKLKNWYNGDTANFGIGQGDLLVSPIQAARMMAVIANAGKLIKPYIIESVDGKPIIHPLATPLGLNPSNIKTVAIGLRQAVELSSATANIINMPNLQIAGKTGTAQVQGKLSHGWFVGFAPYDKPKIVFCFFLENCGPSVYTVMMARKIFTRMIEEKLI